MAAAAPNAYNALQTYLANSKVTRVLPKNEGPGQKAPPTEKLNTPPEETEQPKEEEQEQGPPAGTTKSSSKNYRSKIGVKLPSLPAPGGVGLPLLIVVLLLFSVQIVNGKTRAEWLYRVVTGQSRIQLNFVPAGTGGTGGGPPDVATIPNAPQGGGDTD